MSTTTRTLQNQGHHKVSLFSFVSSRPKETQSHALIWKEIRDLLVIRLASRRPLSVTKGRRTKVPPLSPFSIKSGQLGTGPDGAVPAAEERTLHHVAPIPLRPPSASEREERGNQSLGTFAKSPSASAASESVLFPRGTILSLQKSRREGAGRGAVVGGRWMDWVIWIWANVSKARREKRWSSGQTRNFPTLRRRSQHYLLSAPPSTVRLPK